MVRTQRSFGLNTITLTIMFVIISIILLFELIMAANTKMSLDAMEKDLSSDIYANLQAITRAVNDKNFALLQDDINSVMAGTFLVKYVVVTDAKQNEIYSNLNKQETDYGLRVPSDPRTFKIRNAADSYLMTYKPVYVKKAGYNIYLGISQSTSVEKAMNQIWLFLQIFSAIMLMVTLLVSFALARSISKPLAEMEKIISKIAQGDLSGRLEYTKYEEMNQLVNSYNMMANALQRLYSTLEAQVQDRTKELKSAYAELQNTQAMMVHSEKMKSLGELVAGIMHEINNPINFIYGNMTHLSNYSKDLIDLIEEFTKYGDSLTPEAKEAIEKFKEEIDYEFLKSDMPDLIKSCKEGADRAKNIIQDLKSFSRMEEVAITDVDVPQEIDTTLNILHNKIKNKAQVHKEYEEPVPKIEAFGGQLNQVFMNILDNAVGAIEKQGDIWIRIKTENDKNLRIEIEDNGVGMDSETARKVFDPFFTTKPVGQGTGLGMSITHKIIKNHQGSISIESKKGVGTKFIIVLPLNIDRENLKAGALSEGESNG